MRNSFWLLLGALLQAGGARALTVDEVVARNLEARGGAAKLAAIRSLRLTGTASFTIVSVGNHLVTVLELAVLERLDETIADQALTTALATLHTMLGSR